MTALPVLMHSPAASAVTFGPRLVDDRDDAERHAHLRQLDAVGQRVALDDLADGIGQRRERLERLRHRLDARGSQLEPVEQPLGDALRARGRHVRRRWPPGSRLAWRRARATSRASARLRCSVDVIASRATLRAPLVRVARPPTSVPLSFRRRFVGTRPYRMTRWSRCTTSLPADVRQDLGDLRRSSGP